MATFELVDDDIELVLDLIESLVDVPDEMSDPKRDGKDAGNECPDKKSHHWIAPYKNRARTRYSTSPISTGFGSQWLVPYEIQGGRLARINVQFDF